MNQNKSSNILDKLIELGIIFLIIFTPFAFGTTELWSVTIMEVVILVLLSLWFFKMFLERELSFAKTSFISFIFLFIAIVGFQLLPPLTVYFHATKLEFLKILSYIFAFFIIINNIKTRRQINRLISVIIGVGFILAVFAIIQKLSGTEKMFWVREVRETARYFFGPYVNKNHFAGYMGMVIPLAVGFFFAKRHTSRLLILFVIAVMTSALLYSLSRAGAFSMFGSFVFFYLMSTIRKSSKGKLVFLLALLFLVTLIFVWIGVGPLTKEISSFKNIPGSVSYLSRISAWGSTINLIKDHRFFGSGLGAYQYIFPKYRSADVTLLFTHAHNDYLELLAEVGIFGFLVVFVGAVLWLRQVVLPLYFRHDTYVINLTLGGLSAVFAIFLHSFVDFNLHIPANAFLFMVIISLITITAGSKIRNGKETTKLEFDIYKIKRRYRPVFYLGSTVFFICLSVSIISPFIAYNYYQKALYFSDRVGADMSARSSSPQGERIEVRGNLSIDYLNSSIKYDYSNALYHYQLGKLYYKKLSKTKQPDYLIKAINEYQKAVKLNPTNSKYWQSLAWLYAHLSGFVGVQKENVGARFIEPDKENVVAELARTNSYRYNHRLSQKAEKYFKKAIKLAPNNPSRHRSFAQYCFKVAASSSMSVIPAEAGIHSSHYLQTAVEHYKQAISFDPSLTNEALNQYSKFILNGEHHVLSKVEGSRTTKDYNKLRLILPEEISSYNIVAGFLKGKGMLNQADLAYREGIIYLEERTSKNPKDSSAHFNLAELYYYSKIDWQKAKDRYQVAIEIKPDNLFYRECYSKALLQNHEYDDTMKELDEILKIDPDYTLAYVLIARVYEGKGDYKKAISFLKDCLKKAPDNAELHFWIADRSFYHRDEYGWNFTESYYKKALQLAPKNAFYRMWHGIHLFYLGKYEEAVKDLEMALTMDIDQEYKTKAKQFIVRCRRVIDTEKDF
jgi:tetratricopeptide (TPR) repeat protein/O-antigen ligase